LLRETSNRMIDGKVLQLEPVVTKSKSPQPEMPTERQIAANRRNARKGTGPRSRADKRRASRNSDRHGLSVG
jgi:hypothetical protein